jgi:hypothetical protein
MPVDSRSRCSSVREYSDSRTIWPMFSRVRHGWHS